jgi:hypothetical protein
MVVRNTSTCPDCGGELKHYDRVPRLVKTNGGEKQWVKIRRVRCVECRKLHRDLPNYILPYKHYKGDIISGVVNGLISVTTLGFEDYPCEMTMIRWINQ